MKQKITQFVVISLAVILLSPNLVFASETDGTIDSTHKYAWSENIGWINFGATGGNVHVTDSGMTGYGWSANYGWINLNPSGSGVANDAEGTLSGSAWGENTGWIDFSGVTIASDGYFSGYASGTTTGQVSFDCSNTSSCGSSDFKVRTDWRPQSSRSTSTPGAGVMLPYHSYNNDDDSDDTASDETGDDSGVGGESFDFVDIEDHWASEYIESIYEKGIVSGKDEYHYAPNDYLTRAELVKMSLGMIGKEIPDTVSETSFIDVDLSAWYASYVEIAKEEGIIGGYEDGTFRPNSFITRAEALKVVLEAVVGDGFESGYGVNFGDVSEDGWYVKYIAYAVEYSIVNGYGDGTFGPNNYVTRAEIAKVICLLLEMD